MVNEEILSELQRFINVLLKSHNLQVHSLSESIKCCINLLGNVPASKEPIFEYFERIFDTSVSLYIASLESDAKKLPSYDEAILQIQDALEGLIYQGQHAWVDLISVWTLESLGKLSSNYRSSRNMDINTACNIWLGSTAMNCLLEVAARCFEQLNPAEVENCTRLVVNIYAHNSPYFDWVVVRLGGYFPCNIVSKILHHGLKTFTENSRNGLDSEVGILSYLSFAQETYLKTAIKDLIQVNFNEDASTKLKLNTISYLLHLCRKSDILLQTIGSVFLDICLSDALLLKTIIKKLSVVSPPEYHSIDYFSYISNLLIRLNKGATHFILKLAKTSEKSLWCQDFLEFILQEIENDALEEKTNKIANDITEENSKLALFAACSEGSLIEQQTAIRLVIFSSHQTPHIIYQLTAKLLRYSHAENDNRGLGSLIRLFSKLTMDPKSLTTGLHLELEHILFRASYQLEPEILYENLNVLKNLLTVVRLERRNPSSALKSSLLQSPSTKVISTILKIGWEYLHKNMANPLHANSTFKQRLDIEPAKKLKLSYSDINEKEFEKETLLIDGHVHTTLNLLNSLEVGGKDHAITLGENMKLLELTIKYLYSNIDKKDFEDRIYATNCTFSILMRLCLSRRYSRIIALQELIEGALYINNKLFVSNGEVNNDNVVDKKRNNDKSLIKLNQVQNNIQSTVRCVLHAGIIGQGLKNPIKEANEPAPFIKNSFLSAIIACCEHEDIQRRSEGFSLVFTLLVEFISSDVMYNGLTWPDEEFSKVTMERDLQIRRSFKNAPVLWHVMAYIASYKPALYSASVLLRAICASLLHQWRAKSVLVHQQVENQSELSTVTVKFLQIMAMGQLLPPPLDYLHVIIKCFEPHEVALILKECVWNYVKENIPSASTLYSDKKNLYCRELSTVSPSAHFVDPLRNVMQRKLSKLGAFYHHMFVLPELNKIKPESSV